VGIFSAEACGLACGWVYYGRVLELPLPALSSTKSFSSSNCLLFCLSSWGLGELAAIVSGAACWAAD
jgi:hypothetical protein